MPACAFWKLSWAVLPGMMGKNWVSYLSFTAEGNIYASYVCALWHCTFILHHEITCRTMKFFCDDFSSNSWNFTPAKYTVHMKNDYVGSGWASCIEVVSNGKVLSTLVNRTLVKPTTKCLKLDNQVLICVIYVGKLITVAPTKGKNPILHNFLALFPASPPQHACVWPLTTQE